jgi:hypothetical protein
MSVGGVASGLAAKRMATPAYQRANAMPTDYRPVPLGANPADINYVPNQMVPYNFAQQTFTPPNFVMQPNQYGPQVTPNTPNVVNALAGPSAESTMGGIATERTRAAAMSRTLGQQAEQQQAAAEAAARQPARGGAILEVDPVTGKVTIGAEGGRNITPNIQVLEGTGKTATSAAEKALAGQFFNMSATEKIAWSKSLLEGMPTAQGEAIFGKLSPEKIAARMDDRAFAQKAIDKAREMAQMYDDLAKRQANETARRDAAILREQMYDKADMMEESLRNPRPVSGKGQGPKTRAAQRNQLAPEQEIQNALAKPFEVTIRGIGSTK